jgi:hypothetical protein
MISSVNIEIDSMGKSLSAAPLSVCVKSRCANKRGFQPIIHVGTPVGDYHPIFTQQRAADKHSKRPVLYSIGQEYSENTDSSKME